MAREGQLSKPGANPLEIVQDPRVIAAAGGVLGGYMTRKALVTGQRNVFGYAAKGDDGRIHYYAVNPDGSVNKSKEVKSGYLNRILLGLGEVLVGTLAIGISEDVTVDYLGLGFAAGGAANVVMAVLNIE